MPVINGPVGDPRPFDGEPPPEQILAGVKIGLAEKKAVEIRAVRPNHHGCVTVFGPLDGRLAVRSLARLGSQVLPLLEREFGNLDAWDEAAGAVAAH